MTDLRSDFDRSAACPGRLCLPAGGRLSVIYLEGDRETERGRKRRMLGRTRTEPSPLSLRWLSVRPASGVPKGRSMRSMEGREG